VHLAAEFDRAEAIIVLKAVIDWGANETPHGAALFQALFLHLTPQTKTLKPEPNLIAPLSTNSSNLNPNPEP